MNDNNTRLIIPDIHHKVELVERIRTNHPGVPAIFLGEVVARLRGCVPPRSGVSRFLALHGHSVGYT
ncbi:MAG TPA: hypothetical protein VGM62_07375 [Chthoniobacterales bacterium]|jgi:hypothetical protein